MIEWSLCDSLVSHEIRCYECKCVLWADNLSLTPRKIASGNLTMIYVHANAHRLSADETVCLCACVQHKFRRNHNGIANIFTHIHSDGPCWWAQTSHGLRIHKYVYWVSTIQRHVGRMRRQRRNRTAPHASVSMARRSRHYQRRRGRFMCFVFFGVCLISKIRSYDIWMWVRACASACVLAKRLYYTRQNVSVDVFGMCQCVCVSVYEFVFSDEHNNGNNNTNVQSARQVMLLRHVRIVCQTRVFRRLYVCEHRQHQQGRKRRHHQQANISNASTHKAPASMTTSNRSNKFVTQHVLARPERTMLRCVLTLSILANVEQCCYSLIRIECFVDFDNLYTFQNYVS